jgi:hypothetical protein
MLRCVVWYKFTDDSEVLTASIIVVFRVVTQCDLVSGYQISVARIASI